LADKAKNKIQDVAGKAKEKIGKATGDRDTQAKGTPHADGLP
jgi:uncharacterized protein YjbJ (UPF0337 family)